MMKGDSCVDKDNNCLEEYAEAVSAGKFSTKTVAIRIISKNKLYKLILHHIQMYKWRPYLI